MQHTTQENKDNKVQEHKPNTPSEISSALTQSAPKKAPPKVVKNPLFGPTSVSTISKKQKPDPLKVSKSQIKEVKEANKVELSHQEQKLDKKIEQVQKVPIAQGVAQQKKQAVKEQEKPIAIKSESKKPTIKDLFSSDQAKQQVVQPVKTLPQKEPQSIKSVQVKKEQQVTKSIDKFITEEKVTGQYKHSASFKITESFHKNTTLHKISLYTIEGSDNHGPFQITRKYTEFQALRKLVRGRWPGCFLPALTNKSDLKNPTQRQNEVKFILQNFLLGLSYSPQLYYKEEVQLFLKSPDIEIHQMVEQMPVLKVKDVINRFSSCFDDSFFEQKVDTNRLKEFTNLLRKIAANLAPICTKLLSLCQAYDAYSSGMSKYVEFAKGYEKSCLFEYVENIRDKTVISKDQSHGINKLRESFQHNPFYRLYALLSCQARDALAFAETLVATDIFGLRRDEVQEQLKQLQKEVQEISLGHKTIKTVTSRKPKEEIKTQLQEKIKKLNDQKERLIEIQRMAEILLLKLQIEAFKRFRRQSFREVVRQSGNDIGSIIPEVQGLWSLIFEQSRVLLK